MSQNLTRRGLVAAVPGAVVAAAAPLDFADGGHPDAALLALREPYARTLAAARAVSPAHDDAEEAYFAAKEAHPDFDCATLKKMSGLDIAEARWNAALDLNSDVIQQIVETPARSVEGLAFKARICKHEAIHHDLAASIVDDLIAIGGPHA